jgi:hypothetical protein
VSTFSFAYSSKLFVYIVNPISDQKILPDMEEIYLQFEKNNKDSLIKVKACRGEFEPASFILRADDELNDVSITASDLSTQNGSLIDKSKIDFKLVKCWYQAGRQVWEINKKMLVPELLLKDDTLVVVDKNKKKNFVRVNNLNKSEYVDISSPHLEFTAAFKIYDSKILLPFNLQAQTNKQVWITFHVPEEADSGVYNGKIFIKNKNKLQKEIDIELTVLPFDLEQPSISYGIYYRGMLKNYPMQNIGSDDKSISQYLIEIQNMKDHGILYPTLRQGYGELLGTALSLRRRVGLPTDKIFSLGISTQDVEGDDKLISYSSDVKKWKSLMTLYGYEDLYVYGKDEAKGDALRKQRLAWEVTHKAGAKVFASCHEGAVNLVGDLLDVAILAEEFKPMEVAKWQKMNKKVYIYSNPQVGIEDPELYRRNYGFMLIINGYDGVMNYAYQHSMGHIWNDFDDNRWRDHVFAYPTSDGVIDTLQWEGFREAVDDVRYLTTLEELSDFKNSELKSIYEDIAKEKNLELIRDKIIELIISIKNKSN